MNGNTDKQVTTVQFQNRSQAGILPDDGPTNGNAVISPGVYVVTESQETRLLTPGEQASAGLTRLAEAGAPSALVPEIEGTEGVTAVGTFDADGPITPGSVGEFSVDASEQRFLAAAAMLVPSNDMLVATSRPIPLRVGDQRLTDGALRQRGISGSDLVTLFDAGTEPNAPHGEGENQAPVQSEPLQGADEDATVRPVNAVVDGVVTPEIADVAGLSLK